MQLRPRADRLRLPAAFLVALLQRLPALRIAAVASEVVLESPIASMVKAAAASLIALGAVDSVAGATSYSLVTTPSHPSPDTVTEGSQIEGFQFSLNANPQTAAPPESWTLSGQIPPGLEFGVSGNVITGPGTVNTATPELFGTPTTAGTYTMMLTAWEGPDGTELSSSTFTYQVTVTSGPTPTPTPTPTSSPAGGPAFVTQPISVTVAGGTVALNAVATNSPGYQWFLNSSPVSGATGSILVLNNASAANDGSYSCTATNSNGTATSNAATLSVAATSNPGRLVNISSRAVVGTGGNILIAGFAVGGSGTSGQESLLIRASGPALAASPFNLSGTLPDPQLQLFQSNANGTSTLLATNNGWMGNTAISSAAASVGAFPWMNTSSHDSALLQPLSGGQFTAQISGQGGDTGIALAEVYDLTPSASYTPASPRLVNISARVQVGTGGNILIAGFAVGGATARTVLIRASGPAIAASPFDVPGTLPDPELQLYQGSTLLETNAGWGGSAQITSAASSVGAFAWGNPASKDSAILVTLPPGAYTAQVSGASGDTGVALVEVYEDP
jgi:hypothetical protein